MAAISRLFHYKHCVNVSNFLVYIYIYIYIDPAISRQSVRKNAVVMGTNGFEVGTNGDGVILLYLGLCKWQITVIITKPSHITLCVQPCLDCGCSEFNKRPL